MADRPIFFDIDGTLTADPTHPWGAAIELRIRKVRELIVSGAQVVIWSGNGTTYARAFAQAHGLDGALCVGKPEALVDDNPDIRPRDRMMVFTPEEYFR